MTDKVFLDTNVFVYLYDTDNPEKQAKAKTLLEQIGRSSILSISTQVLQEFYVTVTRKFSKQLSGEEILLAMESLRSLAIVQVDVDMIFSAMNLVRQLRLSFWDTLILQAAIKSGCKLLYTEDLQHGQRIGSLTIENPFL
jgi:predicted nucleic acid-binding protein